MTFCQSSSIILRLVKVSSMLLTVIIISSLLLESNTENTIEKQVVLLLLLLFITHIYIYYMYNYFARLKFDTIYCIDQNVLNKRETYIFTKNPRCRGYYEKRSRCGQFIHRRFRCASNTSLQFNHGFFTVWRGNAPSMFHIRKEIFIESNVLATV